MEKSTKLNIILLAEVLSIVLALGASMIQTDRIIRNIIKINKG